MNKAIIPAVVAAMLMTSAAALAFVLKPTRHMVDSQSLAKLEDIIPREFGEWREEPAMNRGVVNPQTEEFLKSIYDETLSRTYVSPRGERIMLSLAFGADQSKATQVHRPEVCYPAQGFQIRSSEKFSLSLSDGQLPAMKLVAVAQQRIEPITYWIVVGDLVVRGSIEQKLAIVKHGMNGVVPHGLLFRVSSIGGDVTRQFDVQEKFINSLYDSLDSKQRGRLYGVRSGALAQLGTDARGEAGR